jgi:hypothetical protein
MCVLTIRTGSRSDRVKDNPKGSEYSGRPGRYLDCVKTQTLSTKGAEM